MTYIPNTKNNYLAFHGLTGYLWCNNHGTRKMAERLNLNEEEWNAISNKDINTTYSERCNATDFFKENIKTNEDFNNYWKLIQKGKSDFIFSDRVHAPMYIGRMV